VAAEKLALPSGDAQLAVKISVGEFGATVWDFVIKDGGLIQSRGMRRLARSDRSFLLAPKKWKFDAFGHVRAFAVSCGGWGPTTMASTILGDRYARHGQSTIVCTRLLFQSDDRLCERDVNARINQVHTINQGQ
jgi:hypothetical protein